MSGLANANATAWTFYLVVFAVLRVLHYQLPHTPLEIIAYVIQTFYQGAALPLISFVSKLEGAKQNKILIETHDATLEEFRILKEEMSLIKELCKGCKYHKDLDV